jgi:hypothetical protein
MLEDILVPIFAMLTTFGSAFGICYVYFSTRHKERMALIDHGADPSIFKTESNPMKVLKWGLFFAGIGCGLLAGNWFWAALHMEPAVAFISMIFAGGGLGLMIFYLIQYKMEKKKS